MPNTFTNPATSDTYDWPIGFETEPDELGKTRTISRTAPTGNIGHIRQQGDDGALILRYKGKINARAHLLAFWEWYKLCDTQTIYFSDFDDQQYEVQITSFTPRRVANLDRGPSFDPRRHHWEYTIEMDVYRIIDGDMKDAGLTT